MHVCPVRLDNTCIYINGDYTSYVYFIETVDSCLRNHRFAVKKPFKTKLFFDIQQQRQIKEET